MKWCSRPRAGCFTRRFAGALLTTPHIGIKILAYVNAGCMTATQCSATQAAERALKAIWFTVDMIKLLAKNVLETSVRRFSRSSKMALGLLLPPNCANCGTSLDTDVVYPQLCMSCQSIFTPSHNFCDRCGIPRRSHGGIVPRKCLECATMRFAFDEVVALGTYQGEIAQAVLKMKYDAGQPLAFALGRHLAQHIVGTGRDNCYDLAACTTKHWLKRFFAGINSPEVIMQGIAEYANLPHAADLLVCRRRISKQSMLSPPQRQRNVRNAWKTSDRYDIRGARVLLVDDILTTGATAHQMSKALKQAGAKRVTMAVVGRATKQQ